MNIVGRHLLLAASLTLALTGATEAASRHRLAAPASWDGRWSGAWGGRDATAITISGNQVVSYEYGGATTPVSRSHVTAKSVVYGEEGVKVILRRTGPRTASASLHAPQGDATAQLTRQ